MVRSLQELEEAVETLGGYSHGIYAERWAPYLKVRPTNPKPDFAQSLSRPILVEIFAWQAWMMATAGF